MPVGTLPYPSAEQCLIAARVITNDASQTIAGNILADTQPFTLPMVDLAHKTLRKMLVKAGINTYTKYTFVIGLTPAATQDPGIQMQLTYTGWFDGLNNNPSPFLPPDLIEPLEIWERQNGTTQKWNEMKQAGDSISTRALQSSFSIWDWQTDTLYLPPATQTNDLKFKYLIATPTIASVNQQIPIADCDMAMGALIAELASIPRGGEAVQYFHARAEQEVVLLATPTAIKEDYGAHSRRPFRATRARGRRW